MLSKNLHLHFPVFWIFIGFVRDICSLYEVPDDYQTDLRDIILDHRIQDQNHSGSIAGFSEKQEITVQERIIIVHRRLEWRRDH